MVISFRCPLHAREIELTIGRLNAPFRYESICQITAITPMPDLVRITKLETRFLSDPKCTQHVKYVTKCATERRRVRKEEKCRREERLGQGSFRIVWLKRRIQGDIKGEVRAVKKIQNSISGGNYRELEAIALFSLAKVNLSLLLISLSSFPRFKLNFI